jgi:soluble lytic murein transglycosylase-like protein
MLLNGVLVLSLGGMLTGMDCDPAVGRPQICLPRAQLAVATRQVSIQEKIPSSIQELENVRTVVSTLGGKPDYAQILISAGREFQIDPVLIAAVTHVESSFRPTAASSRNARGLMQLRPIVIEVLGVTDPWDPHQNIMAGTAYLRNCFERYKHCPNSTYLALAAYNIGPGPVEKLNSSDAAGRFVRKVLRVYNRLTDSPIPMTGKALENSERSAPSSGDRK